MTRTRYSPIPTMHYRHMEQILMVLQNHMSQEMRRHLMREVPAAYNDLCGRTVVTSQVADTGRQVITKEEDE